MGKMTVPTADSVAKKWGEETPKRSTYYETNTPIAGNKWQENATAAAANYKASVQAGNIDQMFKGGIRQAGAAKFSRKVVALAGRFGPGVSAAVPDMQTAVGPFLAELASVELKDRKPRGDAGNYDRVKQIGDRLHAKRLALKAAGGAA